MTLRVVTTRIKELPHCCARRSSAVFQRLSPKLSAPLPVAVAAALTALLISVLSCFALYRSCSNALETEIRDELLRVARTAALMIDGDAHRKFTSPEQEKSAAYTRAVQPLWQILDASEDYAYLYTCIMTPSGDVRFVLDPAREGDADGDRIDDKSHIYQPFHDAPPTLRHALRWKVAATDARPYTTRWGTFIRGYAPIYDSSGRFAGIVVAGLAADHYQERLNEVRKGALMAALCALSLSVLVGFVVCLLQRRVLSGRAAKLQAMAKIASQNIALEKRERYLAALVELERHLLTAEPGASDIYDSAVAVLGPASGASRVYVFENFRDDRGRLFTSQKAEWCASGIGPQIGNPYTLNIPFEVVFPRWKTLLESGEAVAAQFCDLPKQEREALGEQDVHSLLILPLTVDGEFHGFIGFDDCVHTRTWEDVEMDLLRAAAAVLAQTLERHRAETDLQIAQEHLRRNHEELERRVVTRTGELEDAVSLLTSTLEAVEDGIIAIDSDSGRTLYNSRFAQLCDRDPQGSSSPEQQELLIESVVQQVSDRAAFRRQLDYLNEHPDVSAENTIIFSDGRVIEVYTQPRRRGDKIVGRIWSFRDVTQRKQFEDKLAHQAFHDALTGLPNRALFLQQLDSAITDSRRSRHQLAVLFVDLDNFKLVNDSLGHEVGDSLLKAVAGRLTAGVRPGDIVARIGGDEFTILLHALNDQHEALRAAERIVSILQEPLALEGREVFLSASVGIACAWGSDKSAGDLVRNADMAMYRAKVAGKSGYAVYNSKMDEHAVQRLELETALHRAIKQNELRVHYQPILHLQSRKVHAVEAMVRWQHPVHGLIPPAQFISLAEETGLIAPLGRWVLEEACRQGRLWHERYPDREPLIVSVNLSARQLQQPDLLAEVETIVRESGIDPHSLHLEITESVVMKDIDANVEKLHGLRKMGVGLAVDDFGTGYSSMAYLSSLPIDVLKIDRAFVAQISEADEDVAIVRAIVSLARALNLSIISEGIETEEQLAYLIDLGCEHGQGFLFSRPLAVGDIDILLEKDYTETASAVQAPRNPKLMIVA